MAKLLQAHTASSQRALKLLQHLSSLPFPLSSTQAKHQAPPITFSLSLLHSISHNVTASSRAPPSFAQAPSLSMAAPSKLPLSPWQLLAAPGSSQQLPLSPWLLPAAPSCSQQLSFPLHGCSQQLPASGRLPSVKLFSAPSERLSTEPPHSPSPPFLSPHSRSPLLDLSRSGPSFECPTSPSLPASSQGSLGLLPAAFSPSAPIATSSEPLKLPFPSPGDASASLDMQAPSPPSASCDCQAPFDLGLR